MLLPSLIAREFRSAARKKRAHGLRVLFGGGLAAWFCFVALRNKIAGAEALGRAVYDAVIWPLAYGLMLLAPALAAPSIAQERKEDTLGLLFLTRLRPYHIVLAKFTARIAELFWFLLLALPFLALPIWFGGIAHDEVISDALILLGLMLFGSAVGLCASTFFRSAMAAFSVAMIFIIALDLGLYLSQNSVGLGRSRLAWVHVSYDPGWGLFGASNYIVGPNASPMIGGAVDLGLGAGATILILAVATARIAGTAHARVDGGEARWLMRLNRWNRIVNWALGISTIPLLIVLCRGGRSIHDPGPWSLVGYLFAHAVVLVSVVGRISAQKDERALESLVCTPLSNAAIIHRAILGAWKNCWGWFLLLYVPVILSILANFQGNSFRPNIAYVAFLLTGPLVLVIAIGTFCSAYAKSLVRAMAAALGWALLAFFTIYLFLYVIFFSKLAAILSLLVWIAISGGLYLILIKNLRRFATRQ